MSIAAVRDKRFNCGAVLTVIKIYRYMIYVEIFVIVNSGAGRDGYKHSNPKYSSSKLIKNRKKVEKTLKKKFFIRTCEIFLKTLQSHVYL